jgi:hypothetical protein
MSSAIYYDKSRKTVGVTLTDDPKPISLNCCFSRFLKSGTFWAFKDHHNEWILWWIAPKDNHSKTTTHCCLQNMRVKSNFCAGFHKTFLIRGKYDGQRNTCFWKDQSICKKARIDIWPSVYLLLNLRSILHLHRETMVSWRNHEGDQWNANESPLPISPMPIPITTTHQFVWRCAHCCWLSTIWKQVGNPSSKREC